MSEYTENCKRIVEIIRERPWLFRKNAPAFDLEQYLRYFEHAAKEPFFIFPTMLPYEIGILDKYKDKVFNTSFVIGPSLGSISMHTVVQLSKKQHLFLLWGNSSDNRKTVFYGTLHTVNSEDYRTFILDNEKFVYDDERQGGFAGILRG